MPKKAALGSIPETIELSDLIELGLESAEKVPRALLPLNAND